jgi:hypothetical protein
MLCAFEIFPGGMIYCGDCPGPYHAVCFRWHLERNECPRFDRCFKDRNALDCEGQQPYSRSLPGIDQEQYVGRQQDDGQAQQMTPGYEDRMVEGRVINLRQRCVRCHWILSPGPGGMIYCDECPGPHHPTCFQSHIDHDECPRFGRRLPGQEFAAVK